MASFGGAILFLILKVIVAFAGIAGIVWYNIRRGRAIAGAEEDPVGSGAWDRYIRLAWKADPWLPVVSLALAITLVTGLSMESQWRSSMVAERPEHDPVRIVTPPLPPAGGVREIGGPDDRLDRRGEADSMRNREENRRAVREFLDGKASPVCAQDARRCPDGTWVAREGPECRFPACPGERPGAAAGRK